MIVWEEKYSTGVAELDKQHKNLFNYTNDLGQYVANNFGSQATTQSMLRFLDQYIKVHFNHEESCMYKHLCPIADKNKEAHQQFIKQFKATEEKVKNDGSEDEALKELHHFLETWLVEHICKIDTKLKACVH